MKQTGLIPRITRRSTAGLIDQMLVSGSTFLTIAICAHSLSLAEQGKLGYVISIYMMALLTNISFLFQGASVRAPHESDKPGYRSLLLTTQYGLASCLVAIACIGLLFFGDHLGWRPSPTELILLTLFLFTQQLADFGRRSAYIFSDALGAAKVSLYVYPLRIAGLAVFLPSSIETVLWILWLSGIPGAITAFMGQRQLSKWPTFEIRRLVAHLRFSGWLIATTPLALLGAYMPVFLLGVLRGPESVAILASLRSLIGAANVVMEMVETQLPVYMAKLKHAEGMPAVDRVAAGVLRIGGALWVLGMAAIAGVGEWVVSLIFGAQYAGYTWLLGILWLAYGAYFVSRVYGLKHRAVHNLQVEFWGNVASATTAAVFSYPLIDKYGVYGSGLMLLLVAVMTVIIQVLVVRCKERGVT